MKFKPVQLTEKEMKWLTVHFKNTKNTDICARLEIGSGTLHRLARGMGLKKSKQFMRKCQANTAVKAKESHIANGTYPPKGFIIPNSEDFRFTRDRGLKDIVSDSRWREIQKKKGETRRKTIASEKRRILFGLPQRTRLKLVSVSGKSSYRYLLRQRGYIIERASNEVIVTPDTKRCAKGERTAKRYGFRFVNQIKTQTNGQGY